ncbi:unnamed protein product [Acanthoscelides obtectus]|uniref:Uncharacterized protein n=1 Tax=Acanthoscelides obtectus TaxID=200917 RepID=A0A9P0PH37_ACAOB|nr:unnamed protein product [Acanthoscelides obtectus]CAK1654553.1 hypothetical protein AOBTE_LOCUS18672 [Acanthoscelides obtectus]
MLTSEENPVIHNFNEPSQTYSTSFPQQTVDFSALENNVRIIDANEYAVNNPLLLGGHPSPVTNRFSGNEIGLNDIESTIFIDESAGMGVPDKSSDFSNVTEDWIQNNNHDNPYQSNSPVEAYPKLVTVPNEQCMPTENSASTLSLRTEPSGSIPSTAESNGKIIIRTATPPKIEKRIAKPKEIHAIPTRKNSRTRVVAPKKKNASPKVEESKETKNALKSSAETTLQSPPSKGAKIATEAMPTLGLTLSSQIEAKLELTNLIQEYSPRSEGKVPAVPTKILCHERPLESPVGKPATESIKENLNSLPYKIPKIGADRKNIPKFDCNAPTQIDISTGLTKLNSPHPEPQPSANIPSIEESNSNNVTRSAIPPKMLEKRIAEPKEVSVVPTRKNSKTPVVAPKRERLSYKVEETKNTKNELKRSAKGTLQPPPSKFAKFASGARQIEAKFEPASLIAEYSPRSDGKVPAVPKKVLCNGRPHESLLGEPATESIKENLNSLSYKIPKIGIKNVPEFDRNVQSQIKADIDLAKLIEKTEKNTSRGKYSSPTPEHTTSSSQVFAARVHTDNNTTNNSDSVVHQAMHNVIKQGKRSSMSNNKGKEVPQPQAKPGKSTYSSASGISLGFNHSHDYSYDNRDSRSPRSTSGSSSDKKSSSSAHRSQSYYPGSPYKSVDYEHQERPSKIRDAGSLEQLTYSKENGSSSKQGKATSTSNNQEREVTQPQAEPRKSTHSSASGKSIEFNHSQNAYDSSAHHSQNYYLSSGTVFKSADYGHQERPSNTRYAESVKELPCPKEKYETEQHVQQESSSSIVNQSLYDAIKQGKGRSISNNKEKEALQPQAKPRQSTYISASGMSVEFNHSQDSPYDNRDSWSSQSTSSSKSYKKLSSSAHHSQSYYPSSGSAYKTADYKHQGRPSPKETYENEKHGQQGSGGSEWYRNFDQFFGEASPFQ